MKTDDKEKNINRKIYLDEYSGQPVSILVINPMSKERGSFEGGQKPEALLNRIIEMSTNEGDLVLVGTIHKMKRKYIGIEQLDYMDTITLKRMVDVIKGEISGKEEAHLYMQN